MAQADLLKSFLDPAAPKRIRITSARGLVPLPPGDMIQVLVKLCSDADSEVSAAAASTLSTWSEDDVLHVVKSSACNPDVLQHFASCDSSEAVVEAVVLNTATPAAAIEQLAETVSGHLLELILYNKVRILEAPGILEKAKLNPLITGDGRRMVQEIELEFFGSKSKSYTVETSAEEDSAPEATSAEQDLPVPDLSSLEGLPLDPETREGAIFERLAKMTVPQKIQQALFGTREVRAILIRDPNREIARNVLHSPKVSEKEVEAFAAMRSVSDEVLREIGNSREWTRNYTVVQNLVKNPKTPPLVSQRMLNRLQTRELTGIARDRGIPEAVRRNAQRLLGQRLKPK